MRFTGNYKEFEKILTGMNRTIVYSQTKDSMHQIKTSQAEVLNILKSGTLLIQGTPDIKKRFKHDYMHYNHRLYEKNGDSFSKLP
jgi:hypothetical protein